MLFDIQKFKINKFPCIICCKIDYTKNLYYEDKFFVRNQNWVSTRVHFIPSEAFGKCVGSK